MNIQTITTPNGERLVVLSEADFDRMREAAEMVADVAAFDEAERRLASGESELIPLEIAERLLAGENPIRVWREHRGLTIKQLAEQIACAPPYLSQVETGKRDGTVDTLRKIAGALNVTIDDLV